MKRDREKALIEMMKADEKDGLYVNPIKQTSKEFTKNAKEIFENKVKPQIKKAKMKQTAVEWLVDKLEIFATEEQMNIIEQAKAMEKEEIIKASAIAYEDMFGSDGTEYGEKYYNKTFKS